MPVYGPDLRGKTYFQVLTAAVDDIAQHGYDSAERVDYWAAQIRMAAERSMRPEHEVQAMVQQALGAVFAKSVDKGGVLRLNPGVSAYTLQMLRPELHAELNRRVAASMDLIKLNRPASVLRTQQRFRGWATSVPAGGAKDVKRVAQKKELRKALAQLPYEERRVIIDQNAKLFSAINTTVATNGGAIGAVWHSHKDQRGYDGRPTHNARDGKFFLLRGSWAQEAGLVKVGKNGYTDEIEQPAEWVWCKCSWEWKFSLRSIPDECITNKGREALAQARRRVNAA